MKITQLVSHLARCGAACAMVAVSLTVAQAATIEIQFTGMNLVYDGSAIYDGGSTAGGVANPADADALTAVEIYVGGSLVNSITSDISLDVYIPDVTGIPSAAGTVNSQTTLGNPGYFDLLFGTGPLASEYLLVDLENVSITYLDILNVVQFTFGAAISDVFTQNLPGGLVIGDPVTVSFSAQVTPGTLTSAAGLVTGFAATGTGEIRGTLVPEPSTCLLAAISLIGLAVRRK